MEHLVETTFFVVGPPSSGKTGGGVSVCVGCVDVIFVDHRG